MLLNSVFGGALQHLRSCKINQSFYFPNNFFLPISWWNLNSLSCIRLSLSVSGAPFTLQCQEDHHHQHHRHHLVLCVRLSLVVSGAPSSCQRIKAAPQWLPSSPPCHPAHHPLLKCTPGQFEEIRPRVKPPSAVAAGALGWKMCHQLIAQRRTPNTGNDCPAE